MQKDAHSRRLNLPFPAREVDARLASALWRPRPQDSHKGSFGRLLLATGSTLMPGAAMLSGEAALRSGAGYVELLSEQKVLDLAIVRLPELLIHPESGDAAALLQRATAIVAGCGWGQALPKLTLLRSFLGSDSPLLLDADALNLLAASRRENPLPEPEGRAQDLCSSASLWQLLQMRQAPTLLTPHPGEAARLFPELAAQIKEDPQNAALAMARQSGAYILLKGSHSVLAAPSGEYLRNPRANSGLARAGSGDVLSGLIGGLAAQGYALPLAAILGLFIQTEAAAELAAREGESGMRIAELAATFARVFSSWAEPS